MNNSIRLNRFISMSGAASRRKGEDLIRDGRVAVNGLIVTDPAFGVDPDKDTVTLDGQHLLSDRKRQYLLLNKPTGVIVTRKDTHGRATVMNLLGKNFPGVFPVGRLDADTSGVLLLTDDGDLAYRLTHPSYGVEKVYRAEVAGKVDDRDAARLRKGIVLDDGPAAPAHMSILKSGENVSTVEIVMHQGRKRQVRRMLARLGHPVKVLERLSFGGITAQNLPLGSYRPLTEAEVDDLRKKTQSSRGKK